MRNLKTRGGTMKSLLPWLAFIAAALLEVAGDAVVRKGLGPLRYAASFQSVRMSASGERPRPRMRSARSGPGLGA